MATSRPLPVSAAILAGGRSTRMKTDKAMLSLHPGAPPLGAIVVDRMREVANDVFLVSPPRSEYDAFGVPVLPDLYGEAGALGGIASALVHARHDACLLVACDMPFLHVDLLRWMAELPRRYDVLVPVLSGESRQGGKFVFQTLHAIYAKRCLPVIERALAANRRQVIGFYSDVAVVTIVEEEIRRFDPEFRSFFSVNTPEALAIARRWSSAGEG
jgi:molybdopterin-guanine dinucleotide biosynthesis protein A